MVEEIGLFLQTLKPFFEEYATKLNRCVILFSVCMLFLFLYKYAAGAIIDRYKIQVERLAGKIERRYRDSKNRFVSYEQTQELLDSLGVTYYSHGKITPTVWLGYKLAAAMCGLVVGFVFHPVFGILFAILAFKLPELYAKERDARDNEKMLKDIMNIYDIVCLQLATGEYITGILINSYRAVSHPRLKQALIELTGSIVRSNDLLLSMQVFIGKFNNENINSLYTVVKSLSETGRTDALMGDIKKHLTILQDDYNENERIRVTRMGSRCALLIFSAVTIIIFYACFIGLGDIATLLSV